MKIHVLSDIHLEFGDFSMPKVDADVLVLAGDIDLGISGVEAAVRWSKRDDRAVVYVPGNHEYYHNTWPDTLRRMKFAAHWYNVVVLDNNVEIIRGVRFLGCTLWTDFGLFGPSTDAHSMLAAGQGMNDYKMIKAGEGRTLNPLDTQMAHKASLDWLKVQLRAGWDGPTVVVTHHAPSARSLNPNFSLTDKLGPAYASNLDYLFGAGIDLWIHGHTHYSVRYELNGTRVVANCRGYVGDTARPPGAFYPKLVVEV